MQGRFTSPDEFKGGPDELFDFEDDASSNPTFYADLENPQSLNKYQYGYNNPYKFNDPSGHCVPLIVAAAAILISATYCNAPGPNDKIYPSGDPGANVMAGVITLLPIGKAPSLLQMLRRSGTKTVVKQAVQEVKQQAKQTVTQTKQTVKQSVKQTSKQTKKAVSSSKQQGAKKLTKDRSPQGSQTQREDIQAAQEKNKKIGRPDKIRSIKKSMDNEKQDLKKVRNLKDAEEKYNDPPENP